MLTRSTPPEERPSGFAPQPFQLPVIGVALRDRPPPEGLGTSAGTCHQPPSTAINRHQPPPTG
jgi:hypothetical protein